MRKRHEGLAAVHPLHAKTTAELAKVWRIKTIAAMCRLRGLEAEGAVKSVLHYRPCRRMWTLVPGFVAPPEHNPRTPQTRTLVLVSKCMSVVLFQSARELSVKFKCSPEEMARKLLRLYELRLVERMQDPNSANAKFLWRRVPEGYIASIYDVQPGVCGRALDKALGGFTYRKEQSTMRHQCTTQQR